VLSAEWEGMRQPGGIGTANRLCNPSRCSLFDLVTGMMLRGDEPAAGSDEVGGEASVEEPRSILLRMLPWSTCSYPLSAGVVVPSNTGPGNCASRLATKQSGSQVNRACTNE
jgi:hypothetical protein